MFDTFSDQELRDALVLHNSQSATDTIIRNAINAEIDKRGMSVDFLKRAFGMDR